LRLGRKEGVGTSALFKRKKETFSRKGEWVVERERGGLASFFFFFNCAFFVSLEPIIES